MMRGLETFFRRLQSRPRHERRILGIIVYIASAALITVFWLSSLEQSLKFAPPLEKTAAGSGNSPSGREAQEPNKKMASAQEQITPLEALKQAAGAALSSFKELTGEINRLRQESAVLSIPLPAQTPLPKTESKPAGPNKAEVSGQEADNSPAKILSRQMQTKTYSAYATARLIQPPSGFVPEETDTPKRLARIKNILHYNLAEMRQAAVDFYRYLTE